ncbi:MAG: biopolymer transporter ExbD [Pseudomonadota bacterium]
MALGKRDRRRKAFIPPKLQITSMMDMFTIILIFLLFSFSDKPETMKLEQDLELPVSNAKLDYHDHIKLVLSRNSLYLGDEQIAMIQDGKIEGLDPTSLKDSKLYRELIARREGKKESILFLCDRRLSFKTINDIMKTAGMAGYPNFQFGVLKKE